MDATNERNAIVERAFWAACALALAGGVSPLVLAFGQASRITDVVYPFAVAATALAIAALAYRRGRFFSAIVFFLSGLAMSYGVLLIFTVPLRLAVEGVCPASSGPCPPGYEVPMTSVESTGLITVVVFGTLSLFVGFYALSVQYRQRRLKRMAQVWPDKPPEPPAQAVAAEPVADETTKSTSDVALESPPQAG